MKPRTPFHVHARVSVPGSAAEVLERLRTDPQPLAEQATSLAFERAAPILSEGSFRTPSGPRVAAEVGREEGLGVLVVQWYVDEEASGWPPMTLEVMVTTDGAGTDLAVVSVREPGYDLSRNRIDRSARDRLARGAVSHFLDALAEQLSPAEAAVA